MNPELIAIIGAAITLGTAMFGSTRWFRGSVVKSVETRLDSTDSRLDGAVGMLRAEMKEIEGRLRNEIKATEGRLDGAISGLRDDMKERDGNLRDDMRGIREDMKEGDGKLATAIGGLRADMTAGFLNLTDRVSRVEGVIAGAYPGVRNQAQETPQEGVA